MAASLLQTPPCIGQVVLTHPQRIIFPELGVTKLELGRYYEAALPILMPHIEGRGLALVRCPEGIDAQCFFQKHLPHGLPTGVEAIGDALVVQSADGLLALIQFGVIELHTWGARGPDLERPDRLTIDLDPDLKLTWATVADGARQVRALLADLHLKAHLKTTGGKGLHVVVPFRPSLDWPSVKAFAKGFAARLATEMPDLFTSSASKVARQNKIFVDYLRNAMGATAVSAYSVRARRGAPVSIPIPWDALDQPEDLRGSYFNIRNALQMPIDAWQADALQAQTLDHARLERILQNERLRQE